MLWLTILTLISLLSLPTASQSGEARLNTDAVPVIDIDGGCLLGGSAGGKWLKPDALAARMSGGDKYRLFDLNGEWKSMTGGKPTSAGAPCEDTLHVEIPKEIQDSYPSGRHYIGIAAKWNPMPRPVSIENSDNAKYRAAVESILRRKGISKPLVKLSKVVRVDLEGDGVDEVIISSTRADRWDHGAIKPNARAGDYSLIMLRKIVNGKVQTYMLDEEYHAKAEQFSAPSEFEIIAVLDLDGDGIMEILTSSLYYEGDSKIAYSVKGGKVELVLGCGCGA